jgi:hypothetical protein
LAACPNLRSGSIANLPFDAAFYGDPNNRLKDVLIVYYRYEGKQVGVCPGANNTINTRRFFYTTYYLPDRLLAGPTLELSPRLLQLLNKIFRLFYD